MSPIKNNVTRMLDSKKIRYQAFELPAVKLGAVEAAEHLNVPPELVYKTIVVQRNKPGKNLLVVIPGPHEVDLKKVAKCIGEKKVHVPTQREAETLTGLLAGGISPLALINKGFQVILDHSTQQHEQIYISGGQRGLNILIAVQDLSKLTRARVADVSKASANS